MKLNTQPPEKVILRDTGLRDGLQSIAETLPTPQKLEWVRDAYALGIREMEVGSFVPPKLLPQLADTEEVVRFACSLPGMEVVVLAPNLKGAERALSSGAHRMIAPVSVSAAHSKANVRRTMKEMIAEVGRMRAARDACGSSMKIEAGISTAFGCTLQGRVDPDEVIAAIEAVLDVGADQVSVADTVGYGDPRMVGDIFGRARDIAGDRLWSAHFHDTRGLGLANIAAALRAGVRRFDASLGGIGGCPHAPGASGNVATEDAAYMLASMGYDVGLDIEALLMLRRKLAGWLPSQPLYGTLWRAGLPITMKNDGEVTHV